MCHHVRDCDCHLEDPADHDGWRWVPVTRTGTRRQTDAGYYLPPKCGKCGVGGHPCKCEVDDG